jgi:hypothetical protein
MKPHCRGEIALMIAFAMLREYLEFRDIEEEGERVFEEIIK